MKKRKTTKTPITYCNSFSFIPNYRKILVWILEKTKTIKI